MKISFKILRTRRSGDLKGEKIFDILFGYQNQKDLTQLVKSTECKTRGKLEKKSMVSQFVNVKS